jgi:hypothetical protein
MGLWWSYQHYKCEKIMIITVSFVEGWLNPFYNRCPYITGKWYYLSLILPKGL